MKTQFNHLEQKMFNPFENNLHKIMELNIKTVQNLSYIKPIDLFSSKPKEIMEKPMEAFIHNSQVLLNYMTETFTILGSQWLKDVPNLTQNTKKVMNEASNAVEKNVKKASSLAKKSISTGKKTSIKKNKEELKSKPTDTKGKNSGKKDKGQVTKNKAQDLKGKNHELKGKDQSLKQTSSDKSQSNTLHVKPTAQQLSEQGVGSYNKNGSMTNKSNIGDWGHN